ncbi:MAG: beta family protein [Acidobacteriia bacterium]|nr:beta family protein [Terriglobia bacterium]
MRTEIDSILYLPVLRWKAAEVEAFSKLTDEVKPLLTPLFELCPVDFVPKVRKNQKRKSSFATPQEVITAKVVKLSAAIGDQQCLLDLEHIDKEFSGSDGRNLCDQPPVVEPMLS